MSISKKEEERERVEEGERGRIPNDQLPLTNCQLSTVNCQLSTVNCQLFKECPKGHYSGDW
ncbi:MAG: hypothetical protein HC849_32720 [Oscillatoriales cyanobacterium RU_3_3]|nr:hypothetical protein [Oscillatoriales cyanobacterium RU_3_3]NJR23102.1 hypothetical protein [Richelia sp. CSU_2_1]